MRQFFLRFAFDDSGATAVEYAFLLSFIALAILGAITALGSNLGATFNNIAANVK